MSFWPGYDLDQWLPLVALYPEIHYRFRFWFSLLTRREPEILADAPTRVEPGVPIPVLCLIKDADRHLVHLEEISISIIFPGGERQDQDYPMHIRVDQRLWYKIIPVEVKTTGADALITVTFRLTTASGRSRLVVNHNYRQLPAAALKVRVAEAKLPVAAGWYLGEAHYHSSYTEDQVEFGAPLPAARALARAMGLSWLAVTDHSYDLDDLYGNYLQPDPACAKWRDLKKEVETSNNESRDFVTILGEEVSAGNSQEKNVHVLGYFLSGYLPGQGDSAEHWFKQKPELTVPEAIARINQSGAVAYAAHPADQPGWASRFFLGRGKWSEQDFSQGLRGLQVVYDAQSPAGFKEYELWRSALLNNKRLHIIAGSDAHGDFNTTRKVAVPFLKLVQNDNHTFAQFRTGLQGGTALSAESLKTSLRSGQAVVTNGPFAVLTAMGLDGRTVDTGQEFIGAEGNIVLNALSSPEFGPVEQATIRLGDVATGQEQVLGQRIPDKPKAYQRRVQLPFAQPAVPGYIRAEVSSFLQGQRYWCYTNPIWLRGKRA